MARVSKGVVQVERLRDQVYQLIREDLKSGAFEPGQRLVEVELAEKYGVSRTPVREALFQLTRGGFLDSSERGYTVPTYSKKDTIHRLEVKRLLAPPLVRQLADSVTPLQVKRLAKLVEQQRAAKIAGNVERFNEANHAFRTEYCMMCENPFLGRSLSLIEDQFEVSRGRLHHIDENRRLSLEYNEKLLAAFETHDPTVAEAVTNEFLDFLDLYFAEHAPG